MERPFELGVQLQYRARFLQPSVLCAEHDDDRLFSLFLSSPFCSPLFFKQNWIQGNTYSTIIDGNAGDGTKVTWTVMARSGDFANPEIGVTCIELVPSIPTLVSPANNAIITSCLPSFLPFFLFPNFALKLTSQCSFFRTFLVLDRGSKSMWTDFPRILLQNRARTLRGFNDNGSNSAISLHKAHHLFVDAPQWHGARKHGLLAHERGQAEGQLHSCESSVFSVFVQSVHRFGSFFASRPCCRFSDRLPRGKCGQRVSEMGRSSQLGIPLRAASARENFLFGDGRKSAQPDGQNIHLESALL